MIKGLILACAASFLTAVFCPIEIHASQIRTVEWAKLSDRDISPDGKAALSINKDLWRHAETEHFVYHFTDEKEAETVYIHAEVYYDWIKNFFGIKTDRWRKKSHIFIFSDEAMWRDFAARIDEAPGASAFTSGWELFLHRHPYWLSPRKSLAHELTHIIIFRFLEGPIPLSFNEGFSEFVSYRVVAVQFEGNEFDVRTIQLIPPDEYIPLADMTSMRSYPAERTETFYRESELLVRFLTLNYDSEKFYELLRDLSKGERVESAIGKIYGMSLTALEEKFKPYAVVKGKTLRRP